MPVSRFALTLTVGLVYIPTKMEVKLNPDKLVCVCDLLIHSVGRKSLLTVKQTVVKIPKNAVLSSRNCVLSEFLEPLRVGLEAQLTLSLALYSEL